MEVNTVNDWTTYLIECTSLCWTTATESTQFPSLELDDTKRTLRQLYKTVDSESKWTKRLKYVVWFFKHTNIPYHWIIYIFFIIWNHQLLKPRLLRTTLSWKNIQKFKDVNRATTELSWQHITGKGRLLEKFIVSYMVTGVWELILVNMHYLE